ncbi:hypothetical protein HHI36_000126 [Cryptolaemus montrouzieri]
MSKDPTQFISPATILDNFCLMDNGQIKGSVQMFLRLSCFGRSIQTQFEVLHEGSNKQFLFKTPNMGTTFICSKYGTGTSTDFIPISALYNAENIKNACDKTPATALKSVSWTALMERASTLFGTRSSVQSEFLFPEYLSIIPPVKESAMTFDIVSLRARPEDDRFLDFMTGKKMTDLEQSSAQTMSFLESMETTNIGPYYNHNEIIFEQKKTDQEEKNLCTRHKDEETVRPVLRLRGGALTSETDRILHHRLRGGAPSKSPIAECQEVMDQFDRILAEYRKALSPCGQIACNYSPNVTEETCKTACHIKPEVSTNTQGCGLPQCQYAKYKSALMAMDADVEKQFIGPAIIGTCGHPKCSYRADPILPPIHWECPDPLPKGKCKNPNCPYTPHDLNLHNTIAATKGPCGSDQCPYCPPSPCASPNCPFNNLPTCAPAKEAAMKEKTDDSRKLRETKSCAKCPFANPPTIVNMMQFCDNPNCEMLKIAQSGDCGTRPTMCNSPNCPYRNLMNQCSNPDCPAKRKSSSSCSNPDCPFAKTSSLVCTNPNCPFGKSSTEPSSESCENPNCPYNISNVSSACDNPSCPFQKLSKESAEPLKEACANPDCPFNKPSVESCKNPECPFLRKDSEESKESCDNPECPFKRGSKMSGDSQESECECDNPTCPSKKETCLNPNCPFNLRGYEPCTNPNCPHRKYAMGKDLGFCATPDPSTNEYCVDKTCPFHDPRIDQQETELEHLGEERFPGRSMIKIGSQEIEEGAVERTSGDRPSVYDMAPCVIKTCKFMGGNLVCVECGVGTDGKKRGPCPKTCPGDPICPLATARKTKKQPRRRDPSFKRTCSKKKPPHWKAEYPGYKIGHRECVMPYFFVPKRMGWLWNIHTPCMSLKPRRGWRPGAITKTVARRIIKHRKDRTMNPQEERRRKKRKNDDDSESEMICPKPTLEIKKREGVYHITMNPLKDPNILEMNENPYLDCTPMQFKVAKNNLLDPDCVCTDEGELYKYDSSSNDELDIEFTTPAGIIHPDRPVLRRNVKTKQTQYNIKDIPAVTEKDKGNKSNKDKESTKPAKGKKAKK